MLTVYSAGRWATDRTPCYHCGLHFWVCVCDVVVVLFACVCVCERQSEGEKEREREREERFKHSLVSIRVGEHMSLCSLAILTFIFFQI